MKKEGSSREEAIVNKTDSTTHGGNKVLPVTHEASLSSSAERKDQCDKKKPISRMKELLRWAAKTEKGGKFYGKKVLMFRRRGNLKAVQDDDQATSESPKISFRWDVESCSTTSSAYSAFSMASSTKNGQNKITTSTISIPHSESGHSTCRKANWITTDSEFEHAVAAVDAVVVIGIDVIAVVAANVVAVVAIATTHIAIVVA